MWLHSFASENLLSSSFISENYRTKGAYDGYKVDTLQWWLLQVSDQLLLTEQNLKTVQWVINAPEYARFHQAFARLLFHSSMLKNYAYNYLALPDLN